MLAVVATRHRGNQGDAESNATRRWVLLETGTRQVHAHSQLARLCACIEAEIFDKMLEMNSDLDSDKTGTQDAGHCAALVVLMLRHRCVALLAAMRRDAGNGGKNPAA